MGYFAKVENGVVTNVIVADQEFIDAGHVEGTWVETTFGAIGGVIYEASTNGIAVPTDKPCIRKNYADIGGTYDPVLDAFITQKPYNSWILNEQTCLWESPVPYPNDGKKYDWDETTVNWKEIT